MLTGRCLPYGEGITYWPLARDAACARPRRCEAVRTASAARIEDARAIVTDGVRGDRRRGRRSRRTPRRRSWAVQAALRGACPRAAAARRASRISTGVSRRSSTSSSTSPTGAARRPCSLLCLARPELLERAARAGAAGSDNATSSAAGAAVGRPRRSSCSTSLLEQLDGDTRRRRIADAAEGNPLFVEQLARDGRRVRAARGGDRRCPPTIQAAARGASRPTCRETGARSARARRRDRQGVLAERGRTGARTSGAVVGRLPPLVRERSWCGRTRRFLRGEDAFRFRHHVLIRDVAYESMPEGAPGRAARALRRLDRANAGGAGPRARSRRLPPRAGASLSLGAGA